MTRMVALQYSILKNIADDPSAQKQIVPKLHRKNIQTKVQRASISMELETIQYHCKIKVTMLMDFDI